MPKFLVQIYGKVPEEMEIEAQTPTKALNEATTRVIEALTFVAKSSPGKRHTAEAKAEGK
jgi:hypothetical protein